MKKNVWGLIGLSLLTAGPAFAADLAIPAPVYKAAPPAPPSWAGWYIGATAGGGWTNEGIDNSVTSTFCTAGIVGCPASGPSLAAAVPTHFSTDPKGFIGGGEIGYNWQINQFVLGVEADLSGADINGSATQSRSAPIAGFPQTINVEGTASEKLDLFGTVRGRLGFLPSPQLLFYGTGGLAYGHASTATTFSEAVGGACSCGPFPTVSSSSSSTLTGWTVGGGLEWMFAPQWTLKGEYLYYDLGTLNYASPQLSQANAAGTPFFGANVTSGAAVRGNIARAGVNYKF